MKPPPPFPQRYASSIVPYAHFLAAVSVFGNDVDDLHFYHFALAHAELVDRVVDSLFDEDIDAVVGVATVTEFADIHTRSATDMFSIVEVDNILIAVIHGSGIQYLLFFSHFIFFGAKVRLFSDICKKIVHKLHKLSRIRYIRKR